MICLPGLIKASDLQKIGEFKLALRDIALSKASNKARISLAASLKEILRIALEGELKRAEMSRIEENSSSESMSKLTLLSCNTAGSANEKPEISARLWM